MSAHAHVCRHGPSTEVAGCPGECACVCGAVLVYGPTFETAHRWVWCLPDGKHAAFPDPDEGAGTIDGGPVFVLRCYFCKGADSPENLTIPAGNERRAYHKACNAKAQRDYRARRKSA